MPFKPVQAPSSEYSPVSKDLARYMFGKGPAKVVSYSKLRWASEGSTGVMVKEQEINDHMDLDHLTLYSRQFDTLVIGTEKKPTTLLLTDGSAGGMAKTLVYDPDLDVFYEPLDDKKYYGIPFFVETPADYKPTDASGVAEVHYIPVEFDFARTPDVSEVLSKARNVPDPAEPTKKLWRKVKKFDVVNTNPGANANVVTDGTEGIYIWNGSRLLNMTDAEDTSIAYGVNPPSIKAIIDVPIGYYDQALLNDGSVDWFDVSRVLPAKSGDVDAHRRDDLIVANRKLRTVPGCLADDQGGLLQVYTFIYKNQKFRVVAYTSAQADPDVMEEQFLNYMDDHKQYQSKRMFLRRLNEAVASSRGDKVLADLGNLSQSLRDIFAKFDETRCLFLPLSWRNIMDKNVDVEDEKGFDFLKDDDDDSKKKTRSGSPIGLRSRLDYLLDRD